jgi:hypothetical protein
VSDKRKTNLILTMQPDRLGEFFPLLQQGITVEAQVGCSLDGMLSQQWGIPPDYAAERITTIFLNSRPIDSLTTALIMGADVIALSGAMPGLVGATMRRGGYYAPFREGITHHASTGDITCQNAAVRIKLFNLLLPELGPGFLQRGILISSGELSAFFKRRTGSFWSGCRSALLDNFPLLSPSLLEDELFGEDSLIRLSVNFPHNNN